MGGDICGLCLLLLGLLALGGLSYVAAYLVTRRRD